MVSGTNFTDAEDFVVKVLNSRSPSKFSLMDLVEEIVWYKEQKVLLGKLRCQEYKQEELTEYSAIENSVNKRLEDLYNELGNFYRIN